MTSTCQTKSKAERVRELLASLPADCGVMPATELDAEEKDIVIHEDGQELHGSEWVRPQDLEDADDADGLLEYRKGSTPLTLPMLEPSDP